MAYILAIDLGSTQMKLMIMDEKANIIMTVSEAYPSFVKHTGWLEQNPEDWEKALKTGIHRLKQKLDLDKVEVISFSGHMSGIVLLSEQGIVLGPCIMLSDSRSQHQSEVLMETIGEMVKERTGNPINNAFSLPKLLWLKEETPEVYKKIKAWLSPKDYVRYCLTGVIATEYTDAYNSLCVNQKTLDWDEDIIKESTLRKSSFPFLCSPSDIVGKVTKVAAEKYGLKQGIPVVAGGADMACAVLGSGLSKVGDTALTLGTCATFFTLISQIDSSCYGQVTFHPLISKGKMYALGSHINGGAGANWISSILSEKGVIDYKMIAELSKKAMSVPAGSNGMLTLPFLNGSGSPYFCPSDKQHIFGMKINTTREAIFRSQLEGISYNLRQTLLVFQKMTKIEKLMMGGGGTHISIWPMIIRDVFGIPIELFDNPDVSTIGAALIGGEAVGFFESPEQTAKERLEIIETQLPNEENYRKYQKLYLKYLMYYEMMHGLDLKEQL